MHHLYLILQTFDKNFSMLFALGQNIRIGFSQAFLSFENFSLFTNAFVLDK
jgi:hypothetical protein